MRRTLALAAMLTVAALAERAPAQEPMAAGRKLSEWLDLLRGDADRKAWDAAPLALGGSAATPDGERFLALRRKAGLYGLELIGPAASREVVPAILGALREDPDEAVREAAAISIGRLASRPKEDQDRYIPAGPVLVKVLGSDPSQRVKAAAAATLGKMTKVPGAYAEGIPALAVALKEPAVETRRAAADALRRWATPPEKEKRPETDVLAALTRTVPELAAVVKDGKEDALTRQLAAQTLTQIGPPETEPALPALAAVVVDPEAPADVRVAVAEALGKLGPLAAAAAAPLGQALGGSEAPLPVRRAVAAALMNFGPAARDAVPGLKKALKDGDRFVRAYAMTALGGVGKDLGDELKPIVALLSDALNDPALDVRLAAIETFGKLGPETLGALTPEVRGKLEPLAQDPVKEIREAAESALIKLRVSKP